MVRKLALFLGLGIAAGCAAPSPAPKGWQPIAGERNAWSIGSGEQYQEYRFSSSPFGGGLPDLASQVTIATLTQHRGARLQSSVPLTACPGAAGVASFSLPGGRRLENGFSVHNGTAIRITYVRAGGRSDARALEAMRKTLCAL